MTIQSNSLNAFSVAPGRGPSPKPLSILGHDMFVKLANADTGGAVAIFEHLVPAMGRPPLHRHSREDERFYVLDGQITVQVDGERMVLPAGGSALASRGTAHSFQNFSNARAQILVMVTPGGFHHFFERLSKSLGPAGLSISTRPRFRRVAAGSLPARNQSAVPNQWCCDRLKASQKESFENVC